MPNPRFKHYIWLAPESRAGNKMSLILQWLLLRQLAVLIRQHTVYIISGFRSNDKSYKNHDSGIGMKYKCT